MGIIIGSLLVSGLILCTIGSLFGGLTQAKAMALENNGTLGFNHFGIHMNMDMNNKEGNTGNLYKKSFDIKQLDELDMEVGAGTVEIKLSEDGSCYATYSSEERTKFEIKGNKLSVNIKEKRGIFGDTVNDEEYVCIYLPSANVADVDIKLGAGTLETMTDLITDELKVNIGAGEAVFDEVESKKADVKIGAGTCSFDKMVTGEVDFDVAMGECVVKHITAEKADVKVGMGSADITYDCEKEELSYSANCGMGEIVIGGDQVLAGIGGSESQKSEDGEKKQKLDVDCGMGSVNVGFSK